MSGYLQCLIQNIVQIWFELSSNIIKLINWVGQNPELATAHKKFQLEFKSELYYYYYFFI